MNGSSLGLDCAAPPFGLTQPYAVDDAGVVEGVRYHDVLLVEYRFEQPRVCVEARGIKDGVLGVVVCGGILFLLDTRNCYFHHEAEILNQGKIKHSVETVENQPGYITFHVSAGWVKKE